MLMLSSITIGSFGAFTEIQPLASAEPSTAITPAVTLRFPIKRGLCAWLADLVNLAVFMAFPRFRGAEWHLHRVVYLARTGGPEASHPRCRPHCRGHREGGLRGPTR